MTINLLFKMAPFPISPWLFAAPEVFSISDLRFLISFAVDKRSGGSDIMRDPYTALHMAANEELVRRLGPIIPDEGTPLERLKAVTRKINRGEHPELMMFGHLPEDASYRWPFGAIESLEIVLDTQST